MLSRALDLSLALIALIAGFFLAWHYPIGQFVVPSLFLATSALAFYRPSWFLVIIPALLPIMGLAPWTGWITFEEVDILVLAAAAGGYARIAASTRPVVVSKRGWLVPALVGMMMLSIIISMTRGFADSGGFVFGWYQGYDGPMNSIRIGKSFFLALLLIRLIEHLRCDVTQHIDRKLAWGMALGLGAASLAAIWERLAFTGLLNFSSDYRSTALFWEMHVGGAALDGWLLLTVPFAIWALRHARTPLQHVLSLVLIVLAAYAALTTFSRGVYLALLISVPLLAWQTRNTTGNAGHIAWGTLRWTFAILLLATVASLVFYGGGYRGLIALLGVIATALALPKVLRNISVSRLAGGAGVGLLFGALFVLLASVMPKGPYLAYFAIFSTLLLTLLIPQRERLHAIKKKSSQLYCAAFFFALLVSAANVADHWGGSNALWGMLGALSIVLVATLAGIFSAQPLWPDDLRWQGTFMSASVAVCTVVAVFIGGGYMGERFSTSSKDLDGRLSHWNLSLSMLQTPLDNAFGKGLGRYPANYFFAIPESRFPGTYQIFREGDGAWLSLVGARHPMSFGNLFRVSQRVGFDTVGPFEVTLKIRAKTDASIHAEICEKHLLYTAGCAIGQASTKARDGVWQVTRIKLTGPLLSGSPWYAPRIKMFSLAVGNTSGAADIDDVTLTGPDGRNLLANGDFSNGMQRWFFSSDRDHMPWHAKNLLVNVLFDQGYVGLALFLILAVGALWRLNLGTARTHELSPYLSASIVGFLVVGMFDSLMDVPRLALIYDLLLISSLIANEQLLKGVNDNGS